MSRKRRAPVLVLRGAPVGFSLAPSAAPRSQWIARQEMAVMQAAALFAFGANRRSRRFLPMLAFLDFEASSLGKRSYPIEVAWVFEDGTSESYLIRPAPAWTEWDKQAEAIHGISRATLLEKGVSHDEVARRMVNQLAGHDLVASAPSWDGKWLSALLRAAGLPRHSLRLRDSEEACRESAVALLTPNVPAERLSEAVADLLALAEVRAASVPPAHRALADAREEWSRWRAVRTAAKTLIAP